MLAEQHHDDRRASQPAAARDSAPETGIDAQQQANV
jgi:hypothetical protein